MQERVMESERRKAGRTEGRKESEGDGNVGESGCNGAENNGNVPERECES